MVATNLSLLFADYQVSFSNPDQSVAVNSLESSKDSEDLDKTLKVQNITKGMFDSEAPSENSSMRSSVNNPSNSNFQFSNNESILSPRKRKWLECVSSSSQSDEIDQLNSWGSDDELDESDTDMSLSASDSSEVDDSLFLNKEPTEWATFYKDKKDRIKVNLPNNMKTIKKVIYVFQKIKIVNGKVTVLKALIGKTGDTVEKRLINHLQTVNIFNKNKRSQYRFKASDLVKDMFFNCKNFRFGILHALTPEQDLEEFEIKSIKFKKQKYPSLYNKNKGGGGGSARCEEIPAPYYISNPSKITPPRRYQAKVNKNGQLRFQYTPGFYARLKAMENRKAPWQSYIYSIKNQATGQEYIGTSGNPAVRGQQHCYRAEYALPVSHKYDPDMHLSGILHKTMAADPDNFTIGVLPIDYQEPADSSQQEGEMVKTMTLGEAEILLIERKKTLNQKHSKGLNRHPGGEGPIKKQKRV